MTRFFDEELDQAIFKGDYDVDQMAIAFYLDEYINAIEAKKHGALIMGAFGLLGYTGLMDARETAKTALHCAGVNNVRMILIMPDGSFVEDF